MFPFNFLLALSLHRFDLTDIMVLKGLLENVGKILNRFVWEGSGKTGHTSGLSYGF